MTTVPKPNSPNSVRALALVRESPVPLLSTEIAARLGLCLIVTLRHLNPARKAGEIVLVCDGETTRWATPAVAAPIKQAVIEARKKRDRERTRALPPRDDARVRERKRPVSQWEKVRDARGQPVRVVRAAWPLEHPVGPSSVFSLGESLR